MLRSKKNKGCISGVSAHDTRIDLFWSEYNVNAMTHFKRVFEKLEYLGHLATGDNADLWVLHSAHMPVINKIIDEFKELHSNYLLSTIVCKDPLNIFLASSLKIKSSIATQTLKLSVICVCGKCPTHCGARKNCQSCI